MSSLLRPDKNCNTAARAGAAKRLRTKAVVLRMGRVQSTIPVGRKRSGLGREDLNSDGVALDVDYISPTCFRYYDRALDLATGRGEGDGGEKAIADGGWGIGKGRRCLSGCHIGKPLFPRLGAGDGGRSARSRASLTQCGFLSQAASRSPRASGRRPRTGFRLLLSLVLSTYTRSAPVRRSAAKPGFRPMSCALRGPLVRNRARTAETDAPRRTAYS
jgi:hypothetical protein